MFRILVYLCWIIGLQAYDINLTLSVSSFYPRPVVPLMLTRWWTSVGIGLFGVIIIIINIIIISSSSSSTSSIIITVIIVYYVALYSVLCYQTMCYINKIFVVMSYQMGCRHKVCRSAISYISREGALWNVLLQCVILDAFLWGIVKLHFPVWPNTIILMNFDRLGIFDLTVLAWGDRSRARKLAGK